MFTINKLHTWSRRKLAMSALGAGFLAVWVFFLWPTSLGGNTGFVVVDGTSMQPRLHTGDLVLTREHSDYQVGDVVAFKIQGGMVIHRLHSGDSSDGFTTMGDNRDGPDPWTIHDDSIVGQEWLSIPGVGTAFSHLHNPVTIVLVFLALFVLGRKTTPAGKSREDETEPVETAKVPSGT